MWMGSNFQVQVGERVEGGEWEENKWGGVLLCDMGIGYVWFRLSTRLNIWSVKEKGGKTKVIKYKFRGGWRKIKVSHKNQRSYYRT